MTNPDTLDKALDIIREQQAEIARLTRELRDAPVVFKFDPQPGYEPWPWDSPTWCQGKTTYNPEPQ